MKLLALLWAVKLPAVAVAVGSVGAAVTDLPFTKSPVPAVRPAMPSAPNNNLPIRVGQGSGNEAAWMVAYQRPEAHEIRTEPRLLGKPVNAVHRWGPGCIQNFAVGGVETGALMALDCGPNVFAVNGERWQHLEQQFGNQAAFVIGYPINDWHVWTLPSGGLIMVQDFTGGSRGKNQLHIGYTEGGPNVYFNIYGKILERYLELGGPDGPLDTLASDQYFWEGQIRLDFKGDTLTWDPKTGAVWQGRQPELPAVGAGARERNAVAWAISQIGQSHQPDGKPWDGWCDRFVGNAYGKTNSGYHTAYQHWQRLQARGLTHPGDRQVPYGALAFYGPVDKNPAGHVQISIGNGGFVSTGKTIHEAGINEAGNYLGWAYADPEWPGRK